MSKPASGSSGGVAHKKTAKKPAPKKQPVHKAAVKHPKSARSVKLSKTDRAAARKKAAKRGAAGCLPGTARPWVGGANDSVASCVATAIANSLLDAAGYRVTDDDVLEMFRHGGGAEGTTIEGALRQAARDGLAGWYPVFEPAAGACPGVIAGVNLDHAVAVTPLGMVSWGGLAAEEDFWLDGELWAVRWRK